MKAESNRYASDRARAGWAGAMRALAFGALIAAFAHSSTGRACAFHLQKPEQTAVDWIVQADLLVVARNSQDRPFSYEAVEILDGRGPAPDIPFLVDAKTRKRLAADQSAGVLFAYDQDADVWRSLGMLTASYREIVTRAIAEKSTWAGAYHQDRFEIFAALLDHPDPALRNLALQEVDKAPYAMLRSIDPGYASDRLSAQLWTLEGYPLQSIRILLLGLSDDASAHKMFRDQIRRMASRRGDKTLGPIATALVEADGAEGVALIERTFFNDPVQDLGNIEQITEALAIHNGVGTPALRASIGAALTRLINARPETAPVVARQFGARRDWSQAATLQAAMRDNKLPKVSDLMVVAAYVAQAKGGVTQAPLAKKDG